MKSILLKTLIISSFIIIASACNSSKTSEKELESISIDDTAIEITTAQFESSKMILGTISQQTFTEGIKTNGYIDVPPANRAKVTAIMGGYVKNAPLLIGDSVKKGQLLLTLENPDFIELQQEFLKIHEQLIYLESEFDRQKLLFNENITSQKSFLKAESNFKTALASYRGLEQQLKLIHINPENVKSGEITSVISIYAPISGNVTNVFTSLGEFKDSSETLLEIVNNDHKHLELVVFEKDILKVKEEQSIHFSIPESSSEIFNANVHLVGKSIDKNRTVKVHGHIDNEDEPLLVGMFVNAEIITASTTKNALPVSSVIEEGNNFFVLVLKNNTESVYQFEKVAIAIGTKNEDWVEVADGNSALINKQLLIKGAFLPLE